MPNASAASRKRACPSPDVRSAATSSAVRTADPPPAWLGGSSAAESRKLASGVGRRMQPSPSSAGDARRLYDLIDAFNLNMERLNDRIFTHLDYAILAHRA